MAVGLIDSFRKMAPNANFWDDFDAKNKYIGGAKNGVLLINLGKQYIYFSNVQKLGPNIFKFWFIILINWVPDFDDFLGATPLSKMGANFKI